nr:hypothetical protein [Tanacetum cinerariifolium]
DVVDAQELTQYDDVTEVDKSKWFNKLLLKDQKILIQSDLEYLKTRNKEKKYVVSLTKTKAGRQFGYGYLKEIIVRRADQKEYRFDEADFQGDEQFDLVNALRLFIRRTVTKKRVEDVQLGLESYQTKLIITFPQIKYDGLEVKEPYTILYKPKGVTRNKEKKYVVSLTKTKAGRQFGYGYLKEIIVRRADQKEYRFDEADFQGDEQFDLVNALRLFIRRTVIKKRVEDVQLGLESYQTKLIITFPQIKCDGLEVKEPYTILYKPKGYNNQGMSNRAWSVKDHKRTTSMLKKIDKTLLEKQIMRSLKSFVGGR